ncbi:MAG: stage II sporulation protein M [Methanohalobium sp.]|uniref:stage II sporulation protein M n=1 Tax=Methanohalobium sp. TaxID=2837493 RepID=UPI00397E0ED9
MDSSFDKTLNDEDTSGERFCTQKSDVFWSIKLFMLSVIFTFLLGFGIYLVMNFFSDPETVNNAVSTASSTAVKKVEVSSRYISLMWSIFIFNTIAAFTASFGTGLFVYIHHVLIGDLKHRTRHQKYLNVSIKTEHMFKQFFRKIHYITAKTDLGQKQTRDTIQDPKYSIWHYSGFTRQDYQKIAQILPHTIPVIIIVVNGMLIGLLLSYFIFNGILEGYEVMGLKGVVMGSIYSFSYCISAILPHGILELPALLLTAAIGHRFAKVQSNLVYDKRLFFGSDIKNINQSLEYVDSITGVYLKSKPLWHLFIPVTVMLLVAAYIEVYITPEFIEIVMDTMDNVILKLN